MERQAGEASGGRDDIARRLKRALSCLSSHTPTHLLSHPFLPPAVCAFQPNPS